MKKTFCRIAAACGALSVLTLNAFAAEMVLTKEDPTGLTKVSNPEAEVKFASNVYSGVIGGEDNGQWLIGGDNGDTGISLEMLAEYEAIEFDYTCDYVAEGVYLTPAFKVHISLDSRTDINGGPIFNDYLPPTWVPYGPQGEDGKGLTYNAFETIAKVQVEEAGTISISVEYLLDLFDDDSDYLMGIGLGALNNSDELSEDELDIAMAYDVRIEAIRLTSSPSADAAVNLLLEEPEPVVTTTEATTPAPETEATTTTEAPETTAITNISSPATEYSLVTIILPIVGIVIVVAVIIVIVVMKTKK